MKEFLNSPRWYVFTAGLGIVLILLAVATPDAQTRNDVVGGCLFIASGVIGYLGMRQARFTVRRILTGLSTLLVIAAVLSRWA